MVRGAIYKYLGKGVSSDRASIPGNQYFTYMLGSPDKFSKGGAFDPRDRAHGCHYFELMPEGKKKEMGWKPMDGSTIPGGGGQILYTTKDGLLSQSPINASHWMELPPVPKPKLPEPIKLSEKKDSYTAEFRHDGSVQVGCQNIQLDVILEIAERAKKVKEENA